MNVILNDQQSEFLENNSSKVNDVNEWFYMPHWWKKVNENIYEIVSFDKLPESVKEIIKEHRNTSPTNPQQEY